MSRPAGSWRSHLVQLRLVDAIAALTWREVAVDDVGRAAEGPVLLVANHFGGAADAIVLMSVLPRRPRILADDEIWRFPVARQVMEWLGAIPVHRGRSSGQGDHAERSPDTRAPDNTDMFAACHEALRDRELVLIFPEGITREEPSIGEVRTGAARIALGARTAGVKGIRIVPLGIHYDDKAAFRSSVYVRQGEPIELDALVGDQPGSVEELTGVIEEHLRRSAPDYDDWREARALQLAAEAYMRSLEPARSVPIGLRDRLGSWLARRPDHGVVEDTADSYRAALAHAGLTDAWAAEGAGRVGWHGVATLLTWLLMLPYALAGLVVHAVPIAATWLVTRLRVGPAVMATIMPVAATVLFGGAWGFWTWVGLRLDGWEGVWLACLLFPVTFAALVLVTERAHLWARGLRNRLFGRRQFGRELGDRRRAVVELVQGDVAAEIREPAR